MRHHVTVVLILAMFSIAMSDQRIIAHASAAQSQQDALSGDWIVTFDVQGSVMSGELTLKLEGDHLSGTLHTEHTGSGTLTNCSYKEDTVAFRADFAAHQPIEMTARLQDGKLTGGYRTEGRQGKWQATRR